MNILHNEPLREKLASEYVLGTLIGGARRRFESWLKSDAALRRSVAEWNDMLSPMAEFSTAVQPPASVWESLVRRLDLKSVGAKGRASFWLSLREDLSFWRGLGMAATTAAVIMLSVLMMRPAPVEAPVVSFVAMLTDDKAESIALATGDAVKHQMTIKMVKPVAVTAEQSLELWAISADGKPLSVGLIGADGTITVAMSEKTTPITAPILAVTLEPKGGSGNPNAPSGPVVFKGQWIKV